MARASYCHWYAILGPGKRSTIIRIEGVFYVVQKAMQGVAASQRLNDESAREAGGRAR